MRADAGWSGSLGMSGLPGEALKKGRGKREEGSGATEVSTDGGALRPSRGSA